MIQATFQHAETHDHYLPRQRDTRFVEAEQIAKQVNQTKVQDPKRGSGIHDDLVDELIKRTLSLTATSDHELEPSHWTAVQRVVWRSSRLSFERKVEIIEKGSLSEALTAFAIVNAGRWIVHCPLPGCNGAQYASVRDHRFWCVDCDNRAVAGQWMKVVWPDNVGEIEQVLLQRPREAQHWLSGETVADLMEQNQQHEIGK